jgi:hypothetical protein
MSDDLTSALESLKRGGVKVPLAAERSLRKQLAAFAGDLDERTKKELLQKFLAGLKSIIKPSDVLRDGVPVTEGSSPASLTGDITKLLAQFDGGAAIAGALNLRFKIDVATKVMRGAGHFLTDQTDVDEFPAWEFHRIYDRDVPRGYKVGFKHSLVPIPDDDWPARWAEAGDACGDDDWLPWEGDDQGGRGVALKSSGIWAELGSNRDDTLGNPFAPFAFNSGFGTDEVPANECIKLGLMDPGDVAKPAPFDFTKLFEPPASRTSTAFANSADDEPRDEHGRWTESGLKQMSDKAWAKTTAAVSRKDFKVSAQAHDDAAGAYLDAAGENLKKGDFKSTMLAGHQIEVSKIHTQARKQDQALGRHLARIGAAENAEEKIGDDVVEARVEKSAAKLKAELTKI